MNKITKKYIKRLIRRPQKAKCVECKDSMACFEDDNELTFMCDKLSCEFEIRIDKKERCISEPDFIQSVNYMLKDSFYVINKCKKIAYNPLTNKKKIGKITSSIEQDERDTFLKIIYDGIKPKRKI